MRFARTTAVVAMAAAGAVAIPATAASARPDQPDGAVYTLTNSSTANAVAAFSRANDGTLAPVGTFPTGGTGTGAGLGSQGALVLGPGGRELFAVNAGSNSVSAFRVRPGGLDLEGVAPSGGQTPISLTVHGDRLYVVNSGGAGNISGFDVSGHGLVPLPGSTQPLGAGSAAPAQIAFTPDGDTLVVTEKTSSTIDTYPVGRRGIAGAPSVHAAAGQTPFGFDFDRRGHLLTSDASGSASSYRLARDGDVAVISGAVSTNGQAAPCWLVVNDDSRYAYTANAGSGTISGYRVARDGTLTLRDPSGITADLGAGSHPLDEAVTADGDFLYNLTDGQHAITGLAIGRDGALTTLTSIGGLPVGASGLAAD